MLRIQACITFVLLLAMRSESFTATKARKPRFATTTSTRTTSSSTTVTSQQSHKRQLYKPSSSSSSSSTAASLYSAHFQYNDVKGSSHDYLSVNNRHSANDYWYNIRTLPSSSILRDIRNPVLAVFGWSTVLSIVHFFMMRSGRNILQCLASKVCVSSAAHSFLVSSLGLLLVFRTNSAYQRFYVSNTVR